MPAPYRACLIDALGTMVRLLPPWEHLDPAVAGGLEPERVRERVRGRDALLPRQRRARPRRRVAGGAAGGGGGVLSAGLGREVGVEAMMAAIRFRAYKITARAG